MRIRYFAIAGAGPRMKSVLLQLKIWCSCITERKRACTACWPVRPVKNDRSAFDLFALCLGTKNGIVRFCEAYEQRLRPNVHDFRVIRADAVEGDTYINVAGFLAEWTTGKKICGQ